MKLWGRKPEPVLGEGIDPEATRARSMAEIAALGGRTLAHLPLTEFSTPRSAEAIAARALVLNALANLSRGAPTEAIRDYVASERLRAALTPFERDLIAKPAEALTQQELINASWYSEAIHALAWAGGAMPALPVTTEYPPELWRALPDVEQGETGRDFLRGFALRPYAELYAMRDLYYRAHWFTRDAGLNDEDPGAFHGGIVMERRKALEWAIDATTDWDEMELHT